MRQRVLALAAVFASFFAGLMPAALAQAERTIQSGGFERSYEMLGEQPGRPRPLIIALHGNNGSGAQFKTYGNWARLVASSDVVVAFPDGLNRAWADGRTPAEFRGRNPPAGTDDVGFIVKLAEELVASRIADPRRMYVAGMSNGGMMALRLACDRPELFAGIAVIVASMPETLAARCRPSRPIAILLMNGTEDRLVPNAVTPGRFLGTDGTLAFWRRVNRCTSAVQSEELPDRDTRDGSRIILTASRCPQGADVLAYGVQGGGHQMPSLTAAELMPRLLGARNRDIEASLVIWDFFKPRSR
jgi:polyhydroxybutyrate depolymerase